MGDIQGLVQELWRLFFGVVNGFEVHSFLKSFAPEVTESKLLGLLTENTESWVIHQSFFLPHRMLSWDSLES